MFENIVHKGEEAIKLFDTLKRIDSGDSNPEILEKILNVQKVDFSCMDIKEIPQSICFLRNLEELELQFNRIVSLPETIGALSRLKFLDLHNNHIRFIPKEIGSMINLSALNLDWNDVEELPEEIGNLKNLSNLSLIGNRLRTLPVAVGSLSELLVLDLQTNQIISLPDSMRNLHKLDTFDLSENPISIFPEFICTLKTLKRLGIAKMKFHQFPEEILKLNLPFRHNTLFDIGSPEGIYIFGTVLATQPISLFMQDRSLIENYFKSNKITLQEAKVIFLGDGSVGKTYTIKRLLYNGREENNDNADDYITSETHGIIISNYTSEKSNTKIRFWDFGGQEILHSMHRCFLTERSCYVVMVSTRTPNPMGRARYWLRCIQSFAPNSPIILVINRFSNFGCTGLNETKLKSEFPQLQKVRYLSVKTSSQQEFMLLERDIVELSSELDGTGMEFPTKWEHIRQTIINEAEQNEKFYLTKEDYFKICDECGMTEANSVTSFGDLRIWLLDWFNDLGNCFSSHKDGKGDFAVLNPEWLTNALYLIIYNGKMYTDSGVLSHRLIKIILKHPEEGESGNVPYLKNIVYGEKECEYVLEIMRKFQISYLEDQNNEFIPALSSDNRPLDSELIPKEWDKTNPLHKHFSYKLKYMYLPDVVLYRAMIICRNAFKWTLSPWWSEGMRIDDVPFKLTAVVEIDHNDELRIDVYAYGLEPPWKILQPLKQLFLDINDKMNLWATEFIEVQGVDQKDVFKIEWLLKQRNKGKTEVSGEDEDYKIDELLGTAYGAENLKQAATDAKKSNLPLEIKELNQVAENNSTINNYFVNIYNSENGTINISNYLQLGFSQDELLKYLDILPNRESQVPEEFLMKLASILREQAKEYTELQKNAFVRLADQLSEISTPKKSRLEKLRDWVGDAANMATIVPVVAGAAPTICDFLQQKLPELIQNFNSMIQLLHFIK